MYYSSVYAKTTSVDDASCHAAQPRASAVRGKGRQP